MNRMLRRILPKKVIRIGAEVPEAADEREPIAPVEEKPEAAKQTDAENADTEETKEYEVVEREIRPQRIICPDCGGMTLEGLPFCDKCGGELLIK